MSHIPQKTIKNNTKTLQSTPLQQHEKSMFSFFLWILAEMSTATFCPWKVRVCRHLFVVKNIQIHRLVPDACV